ncbi:hypothetical protein IT418_02095, partial [bacterium]|nr:hypothetical protein [bacterium]
RANTPHEFADRVPDVIALVERGKRELKTGRVPLEELIVRQKLSRTLDGYKSPSPAARAAQQLQAIGRKIAPGQLVEFLFTKNGSAVHAWDLEERPHPDWLDIRQYNFLLDRAMRTILVLENTHFQTGNVLQTQMNI